ncbi:MAG: hypothetical protein B7Z08_06485 [Sphingomonadales bacterium 32-68-7]|nr:MAG: hypothetical protein B7Z33_12335 [Sphingomonadales bacterium 12-68-11]OYX09172.1 MAG: hypothetical protein B7Z08_06485 [Sphingomonadales bacterium 32-68-7]
MAATVLAAGSLIGTPIAAQAAAADMARTSVELDGEQQAGGFPFLIVFVVIAAGLGLYFAIDGGDDEPASP